MSSASHIPPKNIMPIPTAVTILPILFNVLTPFLWLVRRYRLSGFILRYPAHLFITLPLIMDLNQCLGKPFRCSLGYRYAAGNLLFLSLCHTFPPPLNHMTACLYPFPALCIISSAVKLFLYVILHVWYNLLIGRCRVRVHKKGEYVLCVYQITPNMHLLKI